MRRTISFFDILQGSVVRKYPVGSFSPIGHSIKSHSAGGANPGSHGTFTRSKANRDESLRLVPSRHVHRRNAFSPRSSAISLAVRGSPLQWPRRSKVHIVSVE